MTARAIATHEANTFAISLGSKILNLAAPDFCMQINKHTIQHASFSLFKYMQST